MIAGMPTRAVLLGVLGIGFLIVALSVRPDRPVAPVAATAPGEQMVALDDLVWFEDDPVSAEAEPAGPEIEAARDGALRVERVELRRGDTLVAALMRQGLERRTAHEIATALSREGADLRRMRRGHPLEVAWDAGGQPAAVRYRPSPWLGFSAEAADGGWSGQRTETVPDVRIEPVRGQVRRSLFHSIEDAGEGVPLVLKFVEIFESEFDFTADTQPGDEFRLLVEKRYVGDTFVDYGRMLAAQYVSNGRTITGVGYQHGARWAYYDPAGRALKKTFLKSPLEFTRITSGFSYARVHPILGGIRPHLAVDYAAPVGTPVWAVAAGVVVSAGWKGGNGIQVHLRHSTGYETLYNHLSRVGSGVRAGARVSQRQVIGYVGSTGLSTGPHLCYRIRHRGQFVNPLNERFVPGEPLPAAERARFVEHAREIVARLEMEAPI